MQPSKHSLPIAVALAVMIIGLDGLTSIAFAKDPPKSYRRYDELGRFDGTMREDREGNLRYYNEKGQYEGYARRKRDGSWRSYDEKGRFKGTFREDPE